MIALMVAALGMSSCKKATSGREQNLHAERGALWWKQESVIRLLPEAISSESGSPGPDGGTAAPRKKTLASFGRVCAYRVDDAGDVTKGEALTANAVALERVAGRMEANPTLRPLLDSWRRDLATLGARSGGAWPGLDPGAKAALLMCTLASNGLCVAPMLVASFTGGVVPPSGTRAALESTVRRVAGDEGVRPFLETFRAAVPKLRRIRWTESEELTREFRSFKDAGGARCRSAPDLDPGAVAGMEKLGKELLDPAGSTDR